MLHPRGNGLDWDMHTSLVLALMLGVALVVPSPVAAQSLPFERTFDLDVTHIALLDVSTANGRIDVVAGKPGQIVVSGDVTVRIGWDVPTNAAELARNVAADPPIELAGTTLLLRPPADNAERRAVTVRYEVAVPPDIAVHAVSQSGATTIRGVTGSVVVRTQSGAIEVSDLGDQVEASSGSGAITLNRIAGRLEVTTGSGAIAGRLLRGPVQSRTRSGRVDLSFDGSEDVKVTTGSGAIRLDGVRGGLLASTQSGAIVVHGSPARDWRTTTGSGRITLTIDGGAGFSVEATTRSGTIAVNGAAVTGDVSPRRVQGTVGAGGPLVMLGSRSGSISLTMEGR
jgi:DUF4097 and DUF4098 domain-containing protein YvlB